MSKSHQHEAQNVHSASVCSKVKIAISFYLSQACQQESTSKEQEQNEKLNVIIVGFAMALGRGDAEVLELAPQRVPADAERISGARLVPGIGVERPQDV